ncbi:hypothetical protein Cni_G29389 [Canna indica]|uniref:Uncharacterized protein n=1 Tax=Canna indica TaxID=4628 RepID=A0AAQ3L4T5_9LILI|nr:hypothetical protein Cni_G29389 [Canna indica]
MVASLHKESSSISSILPYLESAVEKLKDCSGYILAPCFECFIVANLKQSYALKFYNHRTLMILDFKLNQKTPSNKLSTCMQSVKRKVGIKMVNMVQTPTVSEYDMGEGDLYKAPEPILEDPALDPMTAAMSIISGEGDVITAETIKAADIESIQNDYLSDIYYECKKDLLGKSEIEDSISQLLDEKFPNPAIQMDENPALEKLSSAERSMQKSVSGLGYLTASPAITRAESHWNDANRESS